MNKNLYKFTFMLEEDERTYSLVLNDQVVIDDIVSAFADFLVGCTFSTDQVLEAFKDYTNGGAEYNDN